LNAPELTPAVADDLAEAIAYALRFNERGKPLGVRTRDDPAALACAVVQHLARCGFVVMRTPPREAHSTG
jgi:hypothetical protein